MRYKGIFWIKKRSEGLDPEYNGKNSQIVERNAPRRRKICRDRLEHSLEGGALERLEERWMSRYGDCFNTILCLKMLSLIGNFSTEFKKQSVLTESLEKSQNKSNRPLLGDLLKQANKEKKYYMGRYVTILII